MKKTNSKNKMRKGVSPRGKPRERPFRLVSKTYFLTYKGVSDFGEKITKTGLANFLLKENPRDPKVRPETYLVCEQMYDSGEPHFHAILIYPKRKEVITQDHFNYLGIHPNIQTMRNMKAALEYVYKEDPHPYTNMDVAQALRAARARDSSSLYLLLQQQMLKDPLRFDVIEYCVEHNLAKQMYKANYAKALTLIKAVQPGHARKLLQKKSSIKFIDQALIHSNLNPAEIQQFYSHPCYQKIVNHINQILIYPNTSPDTMAPIKTKHLLLVGPADIGKTSLISHRPTPSDPYPGLSHYFATYYLGLAQSFFPPYHSFDFRLVDWEQFTIVSNIFPKISYPRLLNYLDGSASVLPQKGRPSILRQDNPKHILTSNRTLKQHIHKTFSSQQSRQMSLNNLSARIDCVIIPKGKTIHFLRKLFVKP